MRPPTPPEESSRLQALWRCRILDTASERSFDELVQLAASICATPIALISLVDESRQWFKSRVGLSVRETSRDISFCGHAILDEQIFVVPDAASDDRFAGNPLVTMDPKIRFYAGAPLTVDGGHRLGTLCVLDREPRKLSKQQMDALQVLRGAVVTQIELRRAVQNLSDLEALLPMCAWCRSVRTEEGGWLPLLEYVNKAAKVTHGMCPTCAESAIRGGD